MSERTTAILGIIAGVAIVMGAVTFAVVTKPVCPPYATVKGTRNGWYCVVPPLR